MMKLPVRELRERQNRVCYNWGFQFALWCAILWGTCYQLIEMLISREEFLHLERAARDPFAVGTVLSIVLTGMIAVIGMVWTALFQDIREVGKSLVISGRIRWYFLMAAAIGGLGAWATYVTAGLLDTVFAVVGVMCYPVFGAWLSRRWLKEKVSRKIWIGMGVILFGWCFFYLLSIAGGEWGSSVWVGIFLGMITGAAWGVEGAVAGRIADLVDSDTAVAVRFLCESGIWLFLLLLLVLTDRESLVLKYLRRLFWDPFSLLILFVIALCLAFNYFSWYRSFALLGVTKGLLISDTSGFVTVAVGMVLAVSMPGWLELIASLVMMLGIVWVYRHGTEELGTFRKVPLTPWSKKYTWAAMEPIWKEERQFFWRMPLKIRILHYIGMNGPVWDYEAANFFGGHLRSEKKRLRFRSRVRTYMIEAYLAGLLVSVEDAVDETGQFAKGKLLSRYQLTQFGYEQLVRCKIYRKQKEGSRGMEAPEGREET